MNKILIIIILLVLVGIAYLAYAGRETQQISTEIEISAPITKVWGIVSEIDKWQAWSPIIIESKGDFKVGSKIDLTMVGKEKGKDGPKYSPEIIDIKEPNYFQWRAHMLSGLMFTNDKILELEATDYGTKLTHTETFKGLLAPIFCFQMEKTVPSMLDSMNKALKQRAEK